MTPDNDDEIRREVEAKLAILRARAEAYEEFVAPPGQPPLLWQMAMLADAGFTILPPVSNLDPDLSFPELTMTLAEVDWSDEHYCLVGGERFSVVKLPPSYGGHLVRPKRRRPRVATDGALSPAFECEHFERRDLAVGSSFGVRWRSRILICLGSSAAARAVA